MNILPKILIRDEFGDYTEVWVDNKLMFKNKYGQSPISITELMQIICKHYDINCEVQLGQFEDDSPTGFHMEKVSFYQN